MASRDSKFTKIVIWVIVAMMVLTLIAVLLPTLA